MKMIFKGNYTGGSSRRGAIVVADGKSWIALRDTRTVPGTSDDWTLATVADELWAIPDPIPGPPGKSIVGPPGKDSTVPGPPGRDGKSLTLKQSWNRRTNYQEFDVVEHLGSSYVATKASRGREPNESSVVWMLLAAKGERGPKGEQGGAGQRGRSFPHFLVEDRLAALEAGGESPIPAIFASDTLVGMAVYVAGPNSVGLAQANDPSTAKVIGLASVDVSAGSAGTLTTEGQIERDNWAVVAGTSLLTPGATYYLSPTVAGGLTISAPGSDGLFVVAVGRAISQTILDIEIAEGVKL